MKIILQSLSEMRRADLEFNIDRLNSKTFRTGRKVKIDNLEIEPIHVDHSVPGAYGFLTHTSSGSVVSAGDLRLHGSESEMTADFVSQAEKANPAVVIAEGTNMTGASISSEKEVEEKLSSIVTQTDGIVLAEFAYADVDRLNSLHRFAERNNRCLAVSLKQAYLLNALRKDKGLTAPDLSDRNVLIFRKSKKREDSWEKKIAQQHPGKLVDVFDVSKQQCRVALAMSFYPVHTEKPELFRKFMRNLKSETVAVEKGKEYRI